MTRLHSIAIAMLLNLSTPTLVSSTCTAAAMAQEQQQLNGTFVDKKWIVSVFYDGKTYKYTAKNGNDKTGINLAGATIGGTSERRTYTWNNNGTRYQAIWQKKDPDFLRVRVISPRGKEIFNRLLQRLEEGC
jgi:hypothetical protein